MIYFKNPLFLYGLLSLIILIIFHLIKKKKIKIVNFSSNIFIAISHKKISKRLKIKQFLLFLVRALFLIFIVFLISNTSLVKKEKGVTLDRDQSRVIILDNNYQMLYKDGDKTDFEIGKNMIKEFLSQGGGDQYFFDGKRKHQIKSSSQIETLLKKYKISNIDKDSAIKNFIKKSSEFKNIEIVYVTNNRSLIIENMRYVIIPHKNIENQFINSISIKQITHKRYQLNIKVGSISKKNKKITISLFNGDKKLSNVLTSIKPNELKDIIFYFKPKEDSRYKVQIEDDNLVYDNVKYFTIKKRKPSKIVIVNGDPHTIPYLDETFYLMNAFQSTPYRYNWSIDNKNSLSVDKWNNYDLVILNNNPFFQPETDDVKKFLKNGGDIIITLGSNTNLTLFNRFWRSIVELRNFKDLLPIRNYKNLTHFSENFTFLKNIDLNRSEFMEYPIYKYFNLKTKQNIDVAISLNDGTPLLIRKRLGDGELYLWLTSVDRDWNDLPLSTHYAPLWSEIVNSLLKKEQITRDSYFINDPKILSTFDTKGRDNLKPNWYHNKKGDIFAYNINYIYSTFNQGGVDSDFKTKVILKNDKILIPLKNWFIIFLIFVLLIESLIGFRKYFFKRL